jgi:hypothetical protein
MRIPIKHRYKENDYKSINALLTEKDFVIAQLNELRVCAEAAKANEHEWTEKDRGRYREFCDRLLEIKNQCDNLIDKIVKEAPSGSGIKNDSIFVLSSGYLLELRNV